MKILAALLCLKIVVPLVFAQEEDLTIGQELVAETTTINTDIDNVNALLDIIQILDDNSTDSDIENSVTVDTFLGTIHGKVETTDDGVEIHKFLGIPYAQPPVGELRFQPPVSVSLYEDYEAFNFGPMCPQRSMISNGNSVEGDEDCLYLNIFNKASNDSKLKPVMFWIHGGAFVIGSSQTYDPTPLVREDVVVVTINYRLGALGFLNFGNDVAPGNLGLRDQIQALKWVKKMIQYFGGDPQKVTIFGESAGAMSAHALTLSPKAYGLFSGAIFESGTMLLVREDPKISKTHRAAQGVARYFNCSSTYYDQRMLDCLQDLTVEDMVTGTSLVTPDGVVEDGEDSAEWIPIIDWFSRDPVLPHDYLTAMTNGFFNRVPIMTGTVKNDGGLAYPEIEYGEFWNNNGAAFLGIKSSFNLSETTHEEELQSRLIKKFYTGKNSNLIETLPDYANMMTDSLFLSPDQKVAELASQYVPVYNYRFTFPGRHTFLPFYLADREAEFGEETAVAFNKLKPVHADELIYLFDLFELTTEEEFQVRETLVKYWTNFAKYGHPSPLMRDNLTQWLAYSSQKNYMVLDVSASLEKEVENDRMAFWQKIHWNEREAKIEEVNIFKRAFLAVVKFFRGH